MWLQDIPNAEAEEMVGGVSDHAPIVITEAHSTRRGRKPFRFFDFLMRHKDFNNVLTQVWNIHHDGFEMFHVTS